MNGSFPQNAHRGGESLRIIVLENHVTMGRCLRLYLESRGHTVLTVATPLEARVALLADQFDALIADVYLGGESCASVLRHKSVLPRKVITMSGFGVRKEDLGYLGRRSWPHLIKPFEAEELDALLDDPRTE